MNEARILSILSFLSLIVFAYFCVRQAMDSAWIKAAIFGIFTILAAVQVKRSAYAWREQ